MHFRDTVTKEHGEETTHDVPNGATCNDLEWPLTPISRSWHFLTLNISGTTRNRAIVTIVRQWSRMRSVEWWYFQWPWRTPNPIFKVTTFLKSNMSKNGAFYGQSFYRTLIANHTQFIEWYHFPWSWVTYDPGFKVTPFLKSNVRKTARLKDKVTISH